MNNLIEINDELFEDLLKFKKYVHEFEIKLNRKTNVVDIIAEMEISRMLNLKMVTSIVNPGFDAYDGDLEVQIKSTRTNGRNNRVSKLLNKNYQLSFDYCVFIKYSPDFKIDQIYKSSSQSLMRYFDYINSDQKRALRKEKTQKRDMAISDFIKYSELVFDLDSNSFIPNVKFNPVY